MGEVIHDEESLKHSFETSLAGIETVMKKSSYRVDWVDEKGELLRTERRYIPEDIGTFFR